MVSISHLEAKNTGAFQFVSKLCILLLLPIPHFHNKPADFLLFILPDFESLPISSFLLLSLDVL
jgi:hypothetical protein